MLELLEKGEYGYLAMQGENGYGYGIPISFAFDGKSVYFHCAPEGFKLRSIAENDKVSFCVVGHTYVIPGKFTTEYESVIAFGAIRDVADENEKRRGLELIAQKYSPEFMGVADKYISGSFHRTKVLRLEIEHISGKGKTVG